MQYNFHIISMMLAPTLVPRPLYGRSVYNELRNTKRRKQWEALRRAMLDAAANTCAHCGAIYESHMVCNEVWAYDDQNHVATLTGFEMVCRDCDSVLHYGKSMLISEAKGIDRDERAPAFDEGQRDY
jgi:ribosomal protein L32